MPPAKRPPAPSSSASSGSEEEEQKQKVEEEEEEEGEEDSDDSDSSPKAAAKHITSKPKEAGAPATKTPGSNSDSESESSESDDAKPPPPRRTSRGVDPSIKPISSKPMDATPKSKKSSSQQATEKRKRKEPEAAEEEEATENGMLEKKPFQRVWTEEDEIAVLKGMIQSRERGEEPEAGLDHFLKFIRKSLHSEFSKTQLSDKIRRLKKKYETNTHRSKKGVEPSLFKPHDQTLFELSKKVWGRDANRDYGNDDMEIENAKEERGKATRKGMPTSAVTSPRKDGGDSAVIRGSSLADGNNGEGKGGVSYPKLKEAVTLLESENAGRLFAGSLSEVLELVEPERAKALEEKWRGHFVAGEEFTVRSGSFVALDEHIPVMYIKW
ncbi:hypothetical protein Taro_012871 [Colocasia esculenta]|uniref:Glabrous enhancer-binding protein-like DBD domain-containing protein n=1 Tax=Colocasia esculenta TaxID=4460 RepID=A0A843UEU1_COLES|nr:hypothetical protein [Colocasia esculenta]